MIVQATLVVLTEEGEGEFSGGISPSVEIAIAFPSPSFFPLLPNQIMLFQLLKLFSFVCNGKVIIFSFVNSKVNLEKRLEHFFVS